MARILEVLLFAGLLVAAIVAREHGHREKYDDDDDDHDDDDERLGPECPHFRLFRDLSHNYEKQAIPIGEDGGPVKVTFGMVLRHLDVDPVKHELTLLAWGNVKWHDHRLTWDPEQYNGIDRILMCEHHIWTPDLGIYNGLDVDFFPHHKTDVIVHSDGSLQWIPQLQFRTYARHHTALEDLKLFSMKVGSWNYPEALFEPELHEGTGGIDLSDYAENHCWKIVDNIAARVIDDFVCCPGGYPSLRFDLTLEYAC